MGYNPWDCKESDTTEHMHRNIERLQSLSKLSQMAKWPSFYHWVIILCVCVCVHIIFSLFIFWCTLRLFPCLDYWKRCCSKHWGKVIFRESDFISFRYISRSRSVGSYVSSTFNFLRNSIMFSIVSAPIYIPINSAQGFSFLHILTISHLLTS